MQRIIKYIPLQQGLRLQTDRHFAAALVIIKYIPLQQGLRPTCCHRLLCAYNIIKYIPLQQGLRLVAFVVRLVVVDY